jgi:hypothetical protein
VNKEGEQKKERKIKKRKKESTYGERNIIFLVLTETK